MSILMISIIVLLLILICLLITYLILRNINRDNDNDKISNNKNNYWAIENLKNHFKNYMQISKKDNKISIPILYINLDRSTDRRKLMEKQLPLVSNNYSRVSAIDGKKLENLQFGDGEIKFINNYYDISFLELACTLSHIKAIKMAFEKSYDKVLILEDDIIFYLMPLWEDKIKNIIKTCPKDWEIIKLSALFINGKKIFTKDNINKRTMGASAYVVNRKGMINILNYTDFLHTNTIKLGKIYGNKIEPPRGTSDTFLFDISNTYSYNFPLFLLGDTILPSTIHRSHEKEHIELSNSRLNLYKQAYKDYNWNINNNISVVVPCIPRDIKFLERLLDSVNIQTYKPYEVIIAMSGLNFADAWNLQNRLIESYPKLEIIIDNSIVKKYASENRNRGALRASGNIITFIDADDKMHPEKLYYVNKYFNQYYPKILVHSFSKGYDNYQTISSDPEIRNGIKIYDDVIKKDGKIINIDRPIKEWACISGDHHGHVSISRKVIDKIKFREGEKYKRGQDTVFIRDILNRYGRKSNTAMFVNLPLSQYIPSENQSGLITVFILNYKRPHNIYKQLESLNNNPNIDKIIVSNGHPEYAIDKNYIKKYYKTIIIDNFEINDKLGGARRFFEIPDINTNEYILLLDDDILPSNSLITKLLKNIKQNPNTIYGPIKRKCNSSAYYFKASKKDYNTILVGISMVSRKTIENYVREMGIIYTMVYKV